MKTFFTRFFVTLGVIFFLLICAGAYLWFADPFEMRPFIEALAGKETATVVTGDGVDKNPALNEAQEQALETVGIDPAQVPTSITPAQEACFTEKIGSARVAEIKTGDSPTALEVLTARECIE